MRDRRFRGQNRPTSQQPNPAKHAADPAQGKDSSPERPRAESAPPRGEIHEPNTGTDGKDSRGDQKHWLDYAIGIFAFLAAIGGIGASIFSGWQAWTSSDTEQRQLMAYVGITQHGIENFGEQNQVLKITQKNYGLTPAIDAIWIPIQAMIADVGPNGVAGNFPPILCEPPIWVQNTVAIFPTEELPADIHGIFRLIPNELLKSGGLTIADLRTSVTKGQQMTREQIDQVRNGSHAIALWGGVYFKDIFGTRHCTRYCWSFRGQSMEAKDAEICLQHNDTY